MNQCACFTDCHDSDFSPWCYVQPALHLRHLPMILNGISDPGKILRCLLALNFTQFPSTTSLTPHSQSVPSDPSFFHLHNCIQTISTRTSDIPQKVNNQRLRDVIYCQGHELSNSLHKSSHVVLVSNPTLPFTSNDTGSRLTCPTSPQTLNYSRNQFLQQVLLHLFFTIKSFNSQQNFRLLCHISESHL